MGTNGFDRNKIDRYFSGKYSAEDYAYIHEIFSDPGKEKELKAYLLNQFNGIKPEEYEKDKETLTDILYRIHYNINTYSDKQVSSGNINRFRWILRIACIIAFPLAIFLSIQNYQEIRSRKDTWVEIKAPAWTRVQFRLPDGTTGWLNSNSEIKYKGDFCKNRQISLAGEAYFDVAHDEKRPFLVKTKEVDLKVLGTKFNIASFENEENVEVVLEEGKIIFTDNLLKKSYEMRPNDLAVYNKVQNNYSVKQINIKKYIGWTQGRLIFRNDPIDIIAKRLERWYNVDVQIKGDVKGDFRLRATFIDENLEEVLDLMKRSLPINYRIVKGELSPDGMFIKKKVILCITDNKK